jgi:hypothetical protein
MNRIDRIIKAENLLRDGVDPRKIFSSLQGPPGDNFDYYTVYLPCVGYGWVVKDKGGNYKLLSRDVWYTKSSVFKNGRCAVEIDGDRNWIDEEGKIIRPDGWLDGSRDFNDLGVALGKLNGRFCWFNKEGNQLSENWYDAIRGIEDDLSLYLIQEKGKGYNLSYSDGNPLFSDWYFYVSPVHPKERSAVVAREKVDSGGDYESCILDLDSGEELCDWFTWIGGFGDSGWGVVVREESRKDRFNFINLRGKIMTPDKWYEKTEPFMSGKGTIIIEGKKLKVNSSGVVVEEEN